MRDITMSLYSPAVLERFYKFQEECCEAGQDLAKMLSHGDVAVAPNGDVYYNKVAFTNEVGDVLAAIEFLVNHGDIDREQLMQRVAAKRATITDFMRHQTSEPVYNYSLSLIAA
jgi:NTP pyrophosphatase (non-canonical NTP hydrolase)